MNSVEVWLDGGGAADTPPYQLLNIAESLKDNFRSKTIVEFPQLTVVSKGAGHPNKQQRRVRTSNKPERGIKKEDSGANEVETFVNNVKAEFTKLLVKRSYPHSTFGAIVEYCILYNHSYSIYKP